MRHMFRCRDDSTLFQLFNFFLHFRDDAWSDDSPHFSGFLMSMMFCRCFCRCRCRWLSTFVDVHVDDEMLRWLSTFRTFRMTSKMSPNMSDFEVHISTNFLTLVWRPRPQGHKKRSIFGIGPQGPKLWIKQKPAKFSQLVYFSFRYVRLFVRILVLFTFVRILKRLQLIRTRG